MPKRVNVDQLLKELPEAAEIVGFTVARFGEIDGYPLIALTRERAPDSTEPRRIYLSAGIHGDEPAGPLALRDLLRADALPRRHDYFLCPLLNPVGLTAGTRENAEGIDLNRDYQRSRSAEIRAHRHWARQNLTALDLSIHLHEDWETTGFYLYELNLSEKPGYASRMLNAARSYIPVETASLIDGYTADAGVIRPPRKPEIPEGVPEALYFQKRFGGLNYTLEAPSALALDLRVDALKAAVLATL